MHVQVLVAVHEPITHCGSLTKPRIHLTVLTAIMHSHLWWVQKKIQAWQKFIPEQNCKTYSDLKHGHDIINDHSKVLREKRE